MTLVAPADYTCFQTLYRNYGTLVWGLFRHAFPERKKAEAATLKLFQNLCAIGPAGHTKKSVLAAAYAVLLRLPNPGVASRALRALLLEHRQERPGNEKMATAC